MFALKFFCQDKSFKNVTQVFQKILIQVKDTGSGMEKGKILFSNLKYKILSIFFA